MGKISLGKPSESHRDSIKFKIIKFSIILYFIVCFMRIVLCLI